MEDQRTAPGTAGLLLRPEEQVFAAMLDGWGSQQLGRNLVSGTVLGRQRALATHAAAYPWVWSPLMYSRTLSSALPSSLICAVYNRTDGMVSRCSPAYDRAWLPRRWARSAQQPRWQGELQAEA